MSHDFRESGVAHTSKELPAICVLCGEIQGNASKQCTKIYHDLPINIRAALMAIADPPDGYVTDEDWEWVDQYLTTL